MSATTVCGGLELFAAAEAVLDLTRAAEGADDPCARGCYLKAKDATMEAFAAQRVAARLLSGDIGPNPGDCEDANLAAKHDLEDEVEMLKGDGYDE